MEKGSRFGRLVVLSEYKSGKWPMCRCLCDCGKKIDVRAYSLKSGNTRSCGCAYRRDITGQRFGKLTALRFVRRTSKNRSLWLCRCDCGKQVEVQLDSLISGNTRSCGCLVNPSRLLADQIDGTRTGALKPIKRADNSTGVRGVSFNKRRGKFEAYIQFKGVQTHLGLYDTLDEAAAARKSAEQKIFEPFLESRAKD